MFLAPQSAFVSDGAEWIFVVEVDWTDRSRVEGDWYSFNERTHHVEVLAFTEAEAAEVAVDMVANLNGDDGGMFTAARVVDIREPGA